MQRSFYLGAHFGKSLVWHAYNLLLAYFLTNYLGLEPETMGVVVLLLMVFAAVADPVAGWLLSWWGDSLKRATGLQLLGAVLSFLAFWLLFSMPERLTPLQHAVVTGLLFQVAFKLYDIPQNALTSMLSSGRYQVLSLSTGRYVGSASARLAVAGAAFMLIGDQQHAVAPGDRLMAFVLLMCAPAMISSWLFHRSMRDVATRPTMAGPTASTPGSGRMTRALPRGLALLLLGSFCYAAGAALLGMLLPYLGGDAGALTAFSFGSLAWLPAWLWIGRRYSEYAAMVACLVTANAAAVVFAIGGADEGLSGVVLIGASFFYGGGIFGGSMLLWGAMANLIHRHDRATGRRADALSYGLFTFSTKLGIGMSGLLLGWSIGLSTDDPTVTPPFGVTIDAIVALVILGSLMTLALFRSGSPLEGPRGLLSGARKPATGSTGNHR